MIHLSRNCFLKYPHLKTYNLYINCLSKGVYYQKYDFIKFYSTKKPNFFSQFVENIKQDMAKNKEMKDNLKKFREEAQKLEQSDALKKARKKFETVESEASVLKEKLDTLKDKMHEAMDEVGKSDIAKKAGHITGELGKSARQAAETLSEQGQKLGQTGTFQTISQTAEAVKKEIDTSGMRVYKAPVKLRKRKEIISEDVKIVNPNETATDVELHKDSKFYQSWQNFKDNNPYVNKVLDWKIKYDESDNPLIRASRLLTDKMSEIAGGLFQKTELSEALTEICKIDPNFDKIEFLKECEHDIIPNILEAIIRGELEILRDWCHEGLYAILSQPILKAKQLNYLYDCKILDIDNLDLVLGNVTEQGPFLVISFTSQQINCVRDIKGNVVEGDPEKVLRYNYAWVLCRDIEELNPKAAWRLLSMEANSIEQLV